MKPDLQNMIELTENQDPWSTDKRTPEEFSAFCKSSKADDEYPIQYPNDNGPRAAIRVATIALPTLSFGTISFDWIDVENSFSRSAMMLDASIDANSSIYVETRKEASLY